MTSLLKLAPFQERCRREVMEILFPGQGLDAAFESCFLTGAGGTGKTFIAAGVIAQVIKEFPYPFPNRAWVITPRNVVRQFQNDLFLRLKFPRDEINVMSYGELASKKFETFFFKNGEGDELSTNILPIFKPQLVIVDEAHFVKNWKSLRSKHLMGLAAPGAIPTKFLLMSGTPGNCLNHMEALVKLSGLSLNQCRRLKDEVDFNGNED